MTIPIAQRAVLTRLAEPGQEIWQLTATRPVPSPSTDQVLVKTTHIGLNPFDWQSVAYKFGITTEPKVIGRDGAGVVVQVGTQVSRFKEGDRVWFCANSGKTDTGAFQEYSTHDQAELGHTPDNVSDLQAATLGTGLITAGVALFRTLKFDLHDLLKQVEPAPNLERSWILIWGGAGITGIYLIQLARLLGFRVICAASPVNHAYVRSLGAEVVLDRWTEAEELVEQIREATGDDVSLAIDNVGSETALLCHQILKGSASWRKEHSIDASSGPARLVALAGFPKSIEPATDAVRKVELPRISFSTTFYGHADFSIPLLDALHRLLLEGRIKPARFNVLPGGLTGIQAGLERLRAGKGIGGHKLILSIEEPAISAVGETTPVLRVLRKRKTAQVEVDKVVIKRQRVIA